MPPLPDPRSDQELIRALNDGDADAFEALYQRYRDWVLRLAYRFTHDRDDALDVLQETFAYLSKKFPHFQLTASMTTFLYPAVRNLSLEIVRKRRPSSALEPDTLPAPPTVASPDDTRAALAEVLACVPAASREALLMRFVEGMSLAEIAAALEIPLGTVKSRIHNALDTLRRDERTRRYFER